MGNMRFKVGDRVRIKSLDWYNENKNEVGNVPLIGATDSSYDFTELMREFCGKVMTISCVYIYSYNMVEDNGKYFWTDEMIEGLVEEENKPKIKVGDEVRIKGTDIGGIVESIIRGQLIVNSRGSKIPAWLEDVVLMKSVEEEMSLDKAGQITDFEYDGLAYTLPDGYQFKDENGNVINATKIVLEKKKKELPKTYVECSDILSVYTDPDISGYKGELLWTFQKLLICRDAYWKIAGDEMGLGKPWKLSIGTPIYYIYYNRTVGTIKNDYADDIQGNVVLAFPTEEMRNAFYENFKVEIEQCKELL